MTEMPIEQAFATLVDECRHVLSAPGTHAEISLYTYFEHFLESTIGAKNTEAKPQDRYLFFQQADADNAGIPDFRIQRGHELQGWVEVKAVIGKDLNHLTGHDAVQMERFRVGLDNVIFTTGWQWRLYQHGNQVGRDVILGPSTMLDPTHLSLEFSGNALDELGILLNNFSAASQQSYGTAEAAVAALAARAKALKLALVGVGRAGAGSHLAQLESDFKALLFKNGLPFTWERYVDSYVQLAVFGTLLWRLETGQKVSLDKQVGVSEGLHPLLAQCLVILWLPQSRIPILEPLLEELCRTVNNISPSLFAPPTHRGSRNHYIPDPIVHAYEPFFKVYDPAAREASGVYYTPVEIVEHIVSGISHLLQSALGRAERLLDSDARFLDPATGTGTFLLGLANAVAREAADAGLPVDQMVKQVLTNQTSAFELFPGPYTIAHQRLEVALKVLGVKPDKRLPIYLADTLEAPESGTLGTSGFGPAGVEIQHERERADQLKTAESILVILGNPPYERVLERQGGNLEPFAQGLLDEIKYRTPDAFRNNLKSTKDLFVAFWAWALWELQSPSTRVATSASPTITPRDCHGLIGYITNRTWIVGPSLVGLRAMVREGASEVWIFDLGGDQRGAHGAKSFAGGDGNVFGIRTGVAIAWVIFDRNSTKPTQVRYRRLFGSAAEKLEALRGQFEPESFEVVPGRGVDSFLPNRWGSSAVGQSPLLTELFLDEPDTGLQSARDKSRYSPIGTESAEVLAQVTNNKVKSLTGRLGEWSRLGLNQRFQAWVTAQSRRASIDAPTPGSLDPAKLRLYLYRPFDFRWLYDDPVWIDWWRPRLHKIYMTAEVPSLVTIPHDHGNGPAVIHAQMIMDQHSFRGSDGGKGVFSLWHPYDSSGLLIDNRCPIRDSLRCGFSSIIYDWLERIDRPGSVEEAYNYILAVLSAPSYAMQYWQALEADFLRVPLTTDPATFDEGAGLGEQLRQVWSLNVSRHPDVGWAGNSSFPKLGIATHVNDRLVFENGRELTGVPKSAWDFQVSNYFVVRGWFEARRHWTATPAQAKSAISVVSAARTMLSLTPKLDGLLAAASTSAWLV
jgi:hypothetical protein